MGYCGICRVEKRKAQDVGGLQAEANRDADHQKDFAGSDIDWQRTSDNVNLIRSDNWLKDINERIEAAGITKRRKDAVVMLDGLYTASPEFFKDRSKEEILKYFDDCLDFHAAYYCHGDRSLIINAVVHWDETTPHMQVASVPLTEDGRLSAKDIMGNVKDYHDRQDKFFETVTKEWGLERGEITNKEHRRKHIDQMQYKEEQERQRLDGIKAQVREEQTRHEDLTQQIQQDQDLSQQWDSYILWQQQEADRAEAEAKTKAQRSAQLEAENQAKVAHNRQLDQRSEALTKEVEELSRRKDHLMTTKEVKELTGDKTMAGKYVKIPSEDFERLKRTASHVDQTRAEKRKYEKLQREVTQMKHAARLEADKIIESAYKERDFLQEQLASIQLKEIKAEMPHRFNAKGMWISAEKLASKGVKMIQKSLESEERER